MLRLSYYFAKEVFGDGASYYKVGFVNPLPIDSIRAFASQVDELYVIEETDPVIENELRLAGIRCHGKDVLPLTGELLPEVLREKLLGIKTYGAPQPAREKVLPLCVGCPHRGLFYVLSKFKNVMVSSDIGCYSLSLGEPYYVGDSGICMGSSISVGHGFQKATAKKGGATRVVSVLGDSTFLHTGIPSLIDVAYNNSNTVNIILDNRITGMTGHQQNPGTGLTAQGDPAPEVDIPAVCRAIGIRHVVTVDPNDLAAVKSALEGALALNEPSVVITRWPCALKKFSAEDKAEFPGMFQDKYRVAAEKCMGCRSCLKVGCPAIIFDSAAKKAAVGKDCLGCGVCAQVCPVEPSKRGARNDKERFAGGRGWTGHHHGGKAPDAGVAPRWVRRQDERDPRDESAGRVGVLPRAVQYGREVNSPVIGPGDADILVAFEEMEALRWIDYVKPGGMIVVSTERIASQPILTGRMEYPQGIVEELRRNVPNTLAIDAPAEAARIGNKKAAKVILLGAIVKRMKLTDIDWEEIIQSNVKPAFVDVNLKALELGKGLA